MIAPADRSLAPRGRSAAVGRRNVRARCRWSPVPDDGPPVARLVVLTPGYQAVDPERAQRLQPAVAGPPVEVGVDHPISAGGSGR